MDDRALDQLFDRAVLDGVASRIIADADRVAHCPCGARPEIGRTCSGVVTWVACPECETEAADIEEWNANRWTVPPIDTKEPPQ